MYGLIISRASYVGNTVMSILSTKETRGRVKLTSWMINVGASIVGLLTTKCLLGQAYQSMMTLDIMSAARGWMDFSTAHIRNASSTYVRLSTDITEIGSRFVDLEQNTNRFRGKSESIT